MQELKRIGSPIPARLNEGNGTAGNVSEPETMNISTETFHDIPVRIVRHSKGAMFPVADIAAGLGFERFVLTNMMSRNQEAFEDYKGVFRMKTPGGVQEMVGLTRDGVIGLLLMIKLNHIKDPAKKSRILEFRKWAIETIGKVMDGIPVQQPPAPALTIGGAIQKYMIHVDEFARFLDAPKSEVRECILRVVEAQTGEDMEPFRQLIVPEKPEMIIIQPEALPVHDPIRDFLNCCCLPQGVTSRHDLYYVYVKWCGIHQKPIGTRRFVAAIREKKITERKSNGRWYWVGVAIVTKFKPGVELR